MPFKLQPKLHATHRLVTRVPHTAPKEIPTFYSRGLANNIATNCNSSLTTLLNKKLEFGGRALRDKQLDLKPKLPRCLFRLQRSSGDHIDISFWQTTSNLTKSNFAMHCYQFNGQLRIPAAAGFSASRNDLGTKGCGAPR